MRFERLQIVLFRSSSSFFLLLCGSLRLLTLLVPTGTRVLETRVPRGNFIHITEIEVWNSSF